MKQRHTEYLGATLSPSTINLDERSVDLLFYSGVPVKRFDWWTGEEYMLQMSMDPADVKLDRLNSGSAPLLENHMSSELKHQLGVVKRAWIDKSQGYATARFSEREAVEPIWKDVQAGIYQNVSMGISVGQVRDVTPKGERMKHLLAIDWEPFEVSMVPIGADPNAGFLSGAEPLMRLPSGVLVFQSAPATEKVLPTGAPGTEKTAMLAQLELRRRINLNRRRVSA